MRKIIAKLLIGLAITTMAVFGADNTLGTWKLNVEKSKHTPAPVPYKQLTIVREASNGGAKGTVTGERVDGTPVNYSFEAKYDGTVSTAITGQGPFDTLSVRQVNANTLTDERKKTGGAYHVMGRTVISSDGKTMTQTLRGTGGDGKPVTATMVYEKQ
jgi:hypothetical protein